MKRLTGASRICGRHFPASSVGSKYLRKGAMPNAVFPQKRSCFNENSDNAESMDFSDSFGPFPPVAAATLIANKAKIAQLEADLEERRKEIDELMTKAIIPCETASEYAVSFARMIVSSSSEEGASYTELERKVAKEIHLASSSAYQKMEEFLNCGIDERLMAKLKKVFAGMPRMERVCYLNFDETQVTPTGRYDADADRIDGVVDLGGDRRSEEVAFNCLTFMIKAAASDGECVFSYYATSSHLTSAGLLKIVKENLEASSKVGLEVRGLICDQNLKNTGMYGLLAPNGQHFLKHEGINVHLFQDYCHSMRLTRNSMLIGDIETDYGMVSGNAIRQMEFLDENNDYLRLCPKVNNEE